MKSLYSAGTIARGKAKRGGATAKGKAGSPAQAKKRKAEEMKENSLTMNDRQPITIDRGWAEMEVLTFDKSISTVFFFCAPDLSLSSPKHEAISPST